MDNKEDILDALEEFSRKPNCLKIPPLLDQFLRKIATTGETIFPWSKLKPVFSAKLEKCMEEFYEKAPTDELPPCPNVENVGYRDMKIRLLNAVNNFNNAPFTIQRLCELITEPHKHYKRTDKFLRGIEKNIMVVSCVDPYGRRITNEGKSIMNGLDTNGEMKTPERKSGGLMGLFAPPPPPTNSPVMSNPFESRLTAAESSSPTSVAPVSMWPIASRFISNNGDGPWPQAAMAATSSSSLAETTVTSVPASTSKTCVHGEPSSSHSAVNEACQESSSSTEEKSMEVDEAPSSSEQMPSTTSSEETPTVTQRVADSKGTGDARPDSSEATSTQTLKSESSAKASTFLKTEASTSLSAKASTSLITKASTSHSTEASTSLSAKASTSLSAKASTSLSTEASTSHSTKASTSLRTKANTSHSTEASTSLSTEATEAEMDSRQPNDKPKSPETANDEVSSSDVDTRLSVSEDTCSPPATTDEARPTSEAENLEQPASPSRTSTSEECPAKETPSECVSREPSSDNVSDSTSVKSNGQTVESSENVCEQPSPPSSESVTSSENSSENSPSKAEDVSPSSSSKESKEDIKECKDSSSHEEETKSSSVSSLSDSTTPSDTSQEEAMEQD